MVSKQQLFLFTISQADIVIHAKHSSDISNESPLFITLEFLFSVHSKKSINKYVVVYTMTY